MHANITERGALRWLAACMLPRAHSSFCATWFFAPFGALDIRKRCSTVSAGGGAAALGAARCRCASVPTALAPAPLATLPSAPFAVSVTPAASARATRAPSE